MDDLMLAANVSRLLLALGGNQNSCIFYYTGFELQNLNANTTYLVRAAVANPAAISEFSASIRVTTDSNTYTNNEAPAKGILIFVIKQITMILLMR